MGRGVLEYGLQRTERVELASLTSDPTSPEEGEAWLRTDQADVGDDKLAEFRFYDGNSTRRVDVVSPGSTDASVEEILRVQTPNGVGVIPTMARGDAPHPEVSMQHGGSQLGIGMPSAIPDSGGLHAHYDFSQYSGTSGFGDLSGNGYDLVNGSITGVGESINGVQAGEFDGGDDGVWSDTFSDIGTYTAFAVVRFDGSTNNHAVLGTQQSAETIVEWQEYDGRGWTQSTDDDFHHSNNTSSGVLLLTTVNNANTNVLRLNGSEILSYSATAGVANVVGIGSRNPSENSGHFSGAIGEIPIYPTEKTTTEIEEVESYLADKWGLTL